MRCPCPRLRYVPAPRWSRNLFHHCLFFYIEHYTGFAIDPCQPHRGGHRSLRYASFDYLCFFSLSLLHTHIYIIAAAMIIGERVCKGNQLTIGGGRRGTICNVGPVYLLAALHRFAYTLFFLFMQRYSNFQYAPTIVIVFFIFINLSPLILIIIQYRQSYLIGTIRAHGNTKEIFSIRVYERLHKTKPNKICIL